MSPSPEAVERVLRAFGSLVGDFEGRKGEDDAVVSIAELKLGARLPNALRRVYRVSGRHSIHQRHHHLIAVDNLVITSDRHVEFYVEAQGVCRWSYRVDDDPVDPPVFARTPIEGSLQVAKEFEHLSDFLAYILAGQCIDGGLPFAGVLLGRSAPSVQARWTTLRAIGEHLAHNAEAEVRLLAGGILVADVSGYLGLATTSAPAFIRAGQELGLAVDDWSWATLRDEV